MFLSFEFSELISFKRVKLIHAILLIFVIYLWVRHFEHHGIRAHCSSLRLDEDKFPVYSCEEDGFLHRSHFHGHPVDDRSNVEDLHSSFGSNDQGEEHDHVDTDTGVEMVSEV